MSALASALIAASAGIFLLLGALHLLYTFHGRRLWPRDPDLQRRMQEVSPVITRETTMWKTWTGFNASHSFALLLFGSVYGYLALAHAELLLQSHFLLGLGAAVLAGYVFLAWRYFFSIPLLGVLLASALYGAALALSCLSG